MGSQRIYLDNAATTWPKPEAVYRAVDHAQRNMGAALGRGSYRESSEAAKIVAQSRNQIAALINADDSDSIIFTFSCTDSLSTAIFGWLKPGDHVVTSVTEHNSVLRPLAFLERNGTLSLTRVSCDTEGRIDPQEVKDAVNPATRLVALSQVSNVTGTIQHLDLVGQYCQKQQIPLLVDAAQSLGVLPIDVKTIGCDMLAAAGHKGLLGPTGTGILYLSPSIADQLKPLRMGGTGNSETLDRQPESSPEKFESGNMNLPGLIGLAAGVEFLQTEQAIELKEQAIVRNRKFLTGLLKIPELVLYGPKIEHDRVGIFSIGLNQLDCHDAAVILEDKWSIQTRAGLHCAPLMHRALGTLGNYGTLRISPGLFTSDQEVETTLNTIAEIAVLAGNGS